LAPVTRLGAHLAVPEVVALALGTAITTHGHPAGVGDDPAFVLLMADHRGQHAQGQLVGPADADVVHDQIEEHINAGTHLGHAFQIQRREGSGRGTDADVRARDPGVTYALSGANAEGALLFGKGLQGFGVVEFVAGTGVGHDAAQLHAAFAEDARDVDECRVFSGEARAMAVTVDLNPDGPDGVGFVVLTGKSDDCMGALNAVGQHAQVATGPPQRQCLGQFAGRDGDGIQHVADALVETVFGFLQGRDRHTAGAGRDLRLNHRQAFAGLDVGTQTHAEAVHALLHALDIALHARDVHQRGGGVERGDRRRHEGTRVARDRLHSTQLSLRCGSIQSHQSLSTSE
jgi:hypothetical protein